MDRDGETTPALAVETNTASGAALRDPPQRIRAFVTTLARYTADNGVRMGILLHDYRSLSEPRKREISRERDRYDEILRGLIVAGQQEGVVCRELDAKLATLAILGMINTIYQWFRPGGAWRSEHVSAAYTELAIRALACTPQTHALSTHPPLDMQPTSCICLCSQPTA